MHAALLGFVSLALLSGTAVAAELPDRVAQQDGWAAWQVPMVTGVGTPCCFDSYRRHGNGAAVCDLDNHGWNFGVNDDDPQPVTGGNLDVYVHTHGGRIDQVRAYAASCTIRNADKVRRLDPVTPADSIAFLAKSAASADHDVADGEIASLALHADPAATTALTKLAEASNPGKVREQAVFWLALARGVEGAKIVEKFATTDADPKLREHAVFALTQARGYDGYATIRRIAQQDTADHVREQALFWMAQTGDQRAKADIFAAIATEKSDSVREQAVFALSQLKDGEAEAALIGIVKGDYPRKVKEQALFWLGQSGSTQAIDFLDEFLTKAPGKRG